MADRTIVLDINILDNEEPNDFSYLDLVESKLASAGGTRRLGEEEDSKIAEIAKSLEKKYGQMVTISNKGKRRRIRVDDFIDPGEGYDSQDSFIDDSEDVELMVAPTVTTKFGGFFINEGVLESIEDKSMDIEPPPGVQKRVELKNNRRHALKKEKSKQLLERAVKRLAGPSMAMPKQTNSTKNGSHSLDSVLDSVLAYEPESKEDFSKNGSITKLTSSLATNPLLTVTTSNTDETTKNKISQAISNTTDSKVTMAVKTPKPCVLPDLPEHITTNMKALFAFKSPGPTTGKLVLPPQFDKDLLKFDDQMVEAKITKSVRSTVYAYIEETVGIKRKVIMSKLRKLREEKEESKLEPVLVALKDAVAKAMPDILTAYSRDMANYQERLTTWENDKVSNVELKRPGAPKKLFRWNSDCRALLERIVTLRMEAVHNSTGKCVEEEQLKRFYHTLIPLWPDNWISVAALWRAGLPTYQRLKMKFSPPGTLPSPAASVPTPTVNSTVSSQQPIVSQSVVMRPTEERTPKSIASIAKPDLVTDGSSSITTVPVSCPDIEVVVECLPTPTLAFNTKTSQQQEQQQRPNNCQKLPTSQCVSQQERRISITPNIRVTGQLPHSFQPTITSPTKSLPSAMAAQSPNKPLSKYQKSVLPVQSNKLVAGYAQNTSNATHSSVLKNSNIVDLSVSPENKTPPKTSLPPISSFSPPSIISSPGHHAHHNGTAVISTLNNPGLTKSSVPVNSLLIPRAAAGLMSPSRAHTEPPQQQTYFPPVAAPTTVYDPRSHFAGCGLMNAKSPINSGRTQPRRIEPPSAHHPPASLPNAVARIPSPVSLDRHITSTVAGISASNTVNLQAVSDMLVAAAVYSQRRFSDTGVSSGHPQQVQQHQQGQHTYVEGASLWTAQQLQAAAAAFTSKSSREQQANQLRAHRPLQSSSVPATNLVMPTAHAQSARAHQQPVLRLSNATFQHERPEIGNFQHHNAELPKASKGEGS
uniref:Ubinuclein-1 n=1 Tax=Schistocephalus solidus TaxID=70667 RepID=A0A0V0J9H9_SCHSO